MDLNEIEKVMACTQCGKPAVAAVNNLPLCVSCFYTFEIARTLEIRIHAIHLNLAADEMDFIAPIGLRSPRMQVPEIPKGPPVLNQIKIDNSMVGVINTGSVQSIDATVSVLQDAGDKALSEALKAVTEAVANSPQLNVGKKNELLEQLSFVGEQVRGAASDRRPAVLVPTIQAIGSTATAVSAIAEAWNKVEPMIRAHFGF